MAVLKKNQLNNILFVMVDKTDFATVESTLSAVDINVKLYGVAQNSSALASTITVSKAARLVRSGIFQVTLKATETDAHDHFMLRLSSTSTVSCATQYIPLEMVDYDESDIYSYLVGLSGNISDVESQVDLLATSDYLSKVHSDLRSQISGVGGGTASNIASVVWATAFAANRGSGSFGSALDSARSTISDVDSALSSQFTVMTGASYMSDIASQVWAAKYTQNSALSSFGSLMSDIYSKAGAGNPSDIASKVWAEVYSPYTTATTFGSLIQVYNTASHFSNIASAVWGAKYNAHSALSTFGSLMSDIYSKAGAGDASDIASKVWATAFATNRGAGTFGSALDATRSNVSDVHSLVTALSNEVSDFRSVVTAASYLSDIASNVWAAKYTQNSALSSFGSLMSDIYSKAGAGDASDIASKVWATAFATNRGGGTFGSALDATRSNVSDVQSIVTGLSNELSDFRSVVTGVSYLSDIASQVWAAKYTANSALSSFGSLMSDIYSKAGAGDASDIASKVWATAFATNRSAGSFGSALDTTRSNVSDVHSLVTALSNEVSDFRSVVTAASYLSDIASNVWAAKYTANSALSSFGSLMSDIYSKAGGGNASDIASKVWAEAYSNYTTASTFGSKVATLTGGGVLTVSDISDIASRVWSEKYRAHSLVSSFGSAFSNMWTAANQAASRALLNQSLLSNVDSALTSQYNVLTGASYMSDIASQVWAAKYTANSALSSFGSLMSDIYSKAGAGDASDIASKVWATAFAGNRSAGSFGSAVDATRSSVSDVQSYVIALSNEISDFRSVVTAASYLSDIASNVWAAKYTANSALSSFGSLMSDIYSKAGGGNASDIASKVWAEAYSNYTTASTFGSKVGTLTGGGVLTVSDISDIASRVWSEKYRAHSLVSSFGSAFSSIWTAANQAASRALIAQSLISDVDSALSSQFAALSDAISDFRSYVTSASHMSDIASQVWAAKYTQNSALSSFGSLMSDIYSKAGGADGSDIASKVWGTAFATNRGAGSFGSAVDATRSMVSDVDSAVSSQFAATSNYLSQIQANLSAQISDVDSALTSQFAVTSNYLSNLSAYASNIDSVLSNVNSVVVATAARLPVRPPKNTALAAFEFVMLDTAEDPATGLAVTAQRSIDGGAFAACANAVDEVGSGVYKIDLAASDMNGDTIMLKFTAAAAKTRYVLIVTQTA